MERDGSRACPSLTQIQRIKMHWELSVRGPYNQNRVSNVFSEETLLQDLELQMDSNTRSYGLRHDMLLFLKEETSVTIITCFGIQ